MKRILLTILASSSVLLAGCGASTSSLTWGGVGGAAAGAGTGAIIGSVIANGDIAASALLGGAIGLPVGIALGAIIDYHSDSRVAERKHIQIEKNTAEIYARQRKLDELRNEIRDAGPSGNPPNIRRQYQYEGETLGNYYQ